MTLGNYSIPSVHLCRLWKVLIWLKRGILLAEGQKLLCAVLWKDLCDLSLSTLWIFFHNSFCIWLIERRQSLGAPFADMFSLANTRIRSFSGWLGIRVLPSSVLPQTSLASSSHANMYFNNICSDTISMVSNSVGWKRRFETLMQLVTVENTPNLFLLINRSIFREWNMCDYYQKI